MNQIIDVTPDNTPAAPQSGDAMLSKLVRKSRWIAALTLLATGPLLLNGCFGRFSLTKAVYQFNGDVGNSLGRDSTGRRFFQSIVMWVLIIIPVYGVAMLADAIIFNLVEFWTGDHLEVSSATSTDGTTVAIAPAADGQTASLTVTDKSGKVLSHQKLVKISRELLEVRNDDGSLAGKATRNAIGQVTFYDAAGNVVSTYPAPVKAVTSQL